MYQRDVPWENYLHRFGFKDDTSRGLQRLNLPQYHLAESASLIAAESELKSILDRSLFTSLLNVDSRTVTPEGLQSSFDWAMGSVLWKMELPRQALLNQVSPVRNQGNQSNVEARRRVDTAYLNGRTFLHNRSNSFSFAIEDFNFNRKVFFARIVHVY